MKYMLLIYDDEKNIANMKPDEVNQLMSDYRNFTQELVSSGKFLAGAPLQPIAKATSVRVRQGKPLVTDGPFAETREQLGGYYLVEVSGLEEAQALAARIPSVKFGTIEVRPVQEMGAPAGAA